MTPVGSEDPPSKHSLRLFLKGRKDKSESDNAAPYWVESFLKTPQFHISLNKGCSETVIAGEIPARMATYLRARAPYKLGRNTVNHRVWPLLVEGTVSLDKEILIEIPTPTNWVDKNGYLRNSVNSELVHRCVYYDKFPCTPYTWHVHHINGKKTDNDVENLIALPPKKHQELHKIWPIYALPCREIILEWLKFDRKTTNVKQRRNVRRKLRKIFKEKYEATLIKKEERKKTFIQKIIVRKKLA